MKKIALFTVLIGLFIAAPAAWAVEVAPAQNSIEMQELVFGGAIDSKVAFYQKRIYLADSEFKILADIGKDAIKTTRFLKSNRQEMIQHMMTQNVKLTNTGLNAFLGSKIRTIGTTMEAYSSE